MESRGLKQLKRLHELGLDLIPLKGKRPVERNWVSQERKTWEQLERDLEQPTTNAGVRLGRPLPDGRYLAVLDVDVVGETTEEDREALEAAIREATRSHACPTVISGSGRGSRHIYFASKTKPRTRMLAKSPKRVGYSKGGEDKTGPLWTVELRGYGAQMVAPPSVHPDSRKRYKWVNGAIQNLDSLPMFHVEHPSKPAPKGYPVALVRSLPISEAYQDLILLGDTTQTYASRSEALFAALCVLVRDTRLSDADIAHLLSHGACLLGAKAREKPDPQKWLETQCSAARDRVREQKRGAKAPVTIAERELASDHPVYKELCERHSLVLWGGKPAVFRRRLDPPSHESAYDILSIAALKELYSNKLVPVGTRMMNPVEVWRTSPDRTEYLEGVRMVPPPERCPPSTFNLWQGLAVEPSEKTDATPWVEFCIEVIAAGNEEHAHWLFDWCADLFQSPGNPPGTSVVLRGGEGVGKGTFASSLGHIIGPHFRHVTQESQLTGRFNSHFADSTLIFADELIYGGDKKGRGTLYALVTERVLMVERKGYDAVPMRNLNRMIVASNNDWIVPAGVDARRWFVLDVSDHKRQNTKYFAKLKDWLDKGGYGQVLRFLLDRHISADLRKAPVTKGLIDQKIAGLDVAKQWWLDCVDRGSIQEPVGEAPPEWKSEMPKDRIYTSYVMWCKDRGIKSRNRVHFFRDLRKLVPTMQQVRRRNEDDDRTTMIELPTFEECAEQVKELIHDE